MGTIDAAGMDWRFHITEATIQKFFKRPDQTKMIRTQMQYNVELRLWSRSRIEAALLSDRDLKKTIQASERRRGLAHLKIYTEKQIAARGAWCDRVSAIQAEKDRRAKAAFESKLAKEKLRHRINREKQIGAIRRLVAKVCSRPTAGATLQFFKLWRENTGFGKVRDGEIVSILSDAKSALLRFAVEMARKNGWPHGVSRDSGSRSQFNMVVYVESPAGQLSFLVKPGSPYAELPPHDLPWSELKNTPAFLAALIRKHRPVFVITSNTVDCAQESHFANSRA